MSDSSYFDMSDLDDQNDIELIWKSLQYDQSLQQEEAESSHTCTPIYSERDIAEASLIAYNFVDSPKYLNYYFRRRYRMSRKPFLEIVQGIQTVHPLPEHFKFFVMRPDCTGQMSFSVIMKLLHIRHTPIANGTTPDAFDEYVQMGEHTAHDCLDHFTKCIIQLYTPEVLRKSDFNDIQKLYTTHNTVHGFPKMPWSIDCIHWERSNYLKL
nr:protein ALP1-like [Tanacetum cinerariifolium]